jgi:hypothetical protein
MTAFDDNPYASRTRVRLYYITLIPLSRPLSHPLVPPSTTLTPPPRVRIAACALPQTLVTPFFPTL